MVTAIGLHASATAGLAELLQGFIMNVAVLQRVISVDEYLAGEPQSDIRHEYLAGEVWRRPTAFITRMCWSPAIRKTRSLFTSSFPA